jgi:UDP-glucose 6-dehydrogenase
MNIAVIGTGYVGLVTGACFAEFGINVICVDKDREKIDLLEKGGIPIFEPGLAEIVRRNVDRGRLSFTTDTQSAVQRSLVIFVAVPTPPNEDGSTDLTYVDRRRVTGPAGSSSASRWLRTPSSSERAARWRTSSAPTGSSSAPTTTRRPPS